MELGKVWEKLLTVIHRPSVRHFDLCCGTYALVGNLKILRASSLDNITQHTAVFRFWNMIQFPIGMEDSKDQDASFGFGSEKQGKLSHDWEDANQNGSKEILSMPTTEAEVEVRESVWAS
ncbi:uncharacterized protein C20orf173 homolog [Rousettus aegyptiacus]|uniref:uncharacterized protein C20orf173 homolog n=1 Tax=Rousettus aegyptiacus TaxID=9407 RepID=UPI00168CEFF2|nr:uncharacterized protein C20orf173 homolog [Rousettus aegyptiacus]